jgi:hypothetical protein
MEVQMMKTAVEPHLAAVSAIERPSKSRRILKRTAFVLVCLLAVIFVANWIWILSGSNRWELKIDKDGTQIYTLKAPGSAMLKIRGVTQSREFTLSNHLAPFFDTNIQSDCGKWVAGCTNYQILKQWEPQSQHNVTMWTVSLFPPFAPREFLLQGALSQDPKSKVVTLENIAVPNKLPSNDCCVRLTHMHNVWHYTPLGDGTVKIEFVSDVDMGGAFPTILLNLAGPGEIHKMLTVDNPKLLRQARYRGARLDFIDEGRAAGAAPM